MEQHRDMDLIRALLLDLEGVKKPDLTRYTKDQMHYNRYLLINGNLAKGNATWSSDVMGEPIIIHSSLSKITWEGQEFLADAKNETAWSKTKKTIMEKGGEASFTVVRALLSKYALELFGLS